MTRKVVTCLVDIKWWDSLSRRTVNWLLTLLLTWCRDQRWQ